MGFEADCFVDLFHWPESTEKGYNNKFSNQYKTCHKNELKSWYLVSVTIVWRS